MRIVDAEKLNVLPSEPACALVSNAISGVLKR